MQNRLRKTRQNIARWGLRFVATFLVFALTMQVVTPVVFGGNNTTFGVSFSIKASREIGVDWQEAFTALLDDAKFRNFRLMSYWNEIERSPGNYDFSDLDWQLDQAAERDAKVSLAIGMRQPRWPECHIPQFINQDNQPELEAELTKFVTATVERYKNHPSIVSWQLENESKNTSFGICPAYNHDQTIRIFNLVKSLSPDVPLWMSLSDQQGLPVNEPTPDAFGFSVYRRLYSSDGPVSLYITHPIGVSYHRLRAQAVNSLKDRPTFIHELQAEPWGPVGTNELSDAEQALTMNPRQLLRNVEFAKRIGMDEAYLWGAEWWYWRMTERGDDSLWRTVTEIVLADQAS